MRDYSKLSPRMYTGELGEFIRGDADCLSIVPYLIGGPHANMIGLYRLPLVYIAEDLGLPMERVEKALEKLRSFRSNADRTSIERRPNFDRTPFLRTDERSKVVWVVDSARHEWGLDPNPEAKQVKALISFLLRTHEEYGKSNVFNEFLDMYSEIWPRVIKAFRTSIDRRSNGDRSTPAPAPAPAPDPDPDPETLTAECSAPVHSTTKKRDSPAWSVPGEYPPELLERISDLPALWESRILATKTNRRPKTSAQLKQLKALVPVMESFGPLAVRYAIERAERSGSQGLEWAWYERDWKTSAKSLAERAVRSVGSSINGSKPCNPGDLRPDGLVEMPREFEVQALKPEDVPSGFVFKEGLVWGVGYKFPNLPREWTGQEIVIVES